MDNILKGDCSTNGQYIVSRWKNEISFSKLGSVSVVGKFSIEKNILDFALSGHYVAILQDFSISILNLAKMEIQLKIQTSEQQISISSNHSVVTTLDAFNTVALHNWTGL